MDICKIQVQRHRHAIFRAATLGEHRIAGTREFLIGDRIRFEASVTKQSCTLRRQILVDFEFQMVRSKGRPVVPPRASSAA